MAIISGSVVVADPAAPATKVVQPTSGAVFTSPGPGGPQGDASDVPGPPNVLTIGSVSSGPTPSAEIVGESPEQVLNLVLPKGDKGDKGDDGDSSEGIPNATTSTKGGVVLAGDLAGTFDDPQVPALDGKVNTTGAEDIRGIKRFVSDPGGGKASVVIENRDGGAHAEFQLVNVPGDVGFQVAVGNDGVAFFEEVNAAGVFTHEYMAMMRSAIQMRWHRLEQVSPPESDSDAATRGYVVGEVGAVRSLATDALSRKADLVDGKLRADQVPELAVVQYLGSVDSESAMLQLDGQSGDWCIRSDLGTMWLVKGDPATIEGWHQLAYPASSVVSVAGRTGAVTLSAGDIDAGVFTVDRLPVGQGAGRVAAGDDPRLSDARPPAPGSVVSGSIADGEVTAPKLSSAVQTSLGKADSAVQGSGLTLWEGTQASYDAIGTKDANTVYVIAG